MRTPRRSQDIRQSFLDFFVARGHRLQSSSPLVPQGDPTLLFTNAGMVQFKDVFLGLETFEPPRAVTVQKCLRVSGKHNDLENVGPSPRHHTFFEMLGNFSFGDYFKEEAIRLAWELVTEVWGIPPRDLFATVYEEDEEARDLWRRLTTLPAERIVGCGKQDNFWAMGETGPCGPCSEIFIDRFADRPKVPFAEGAESGRYLEIWNLVFMQYERTAEGSLVPLPRPSIDTGSGLERVTAALQGVDSNYDTDLFQPLLQAISARAGVSYGPGPGAGDARPVDLQAASDVSMRVIADHIRAVAFLLADGVVPAPDGRGYVLRRILRRAVRHGQRLGFEEPFLGELLPVLVSVMGGAYPELGATAAASAATLRVEEEKYLATVAAGARQVQAVIEEKKNEVLSSDGRGTLEGEEVFRLYDTYGLPLDVIREIAEEERFFLDEQGFERELERQRARSRSATAGLQQQMAELRRALVEGADLPATAFFGYDELRLSGARLLRLARLRDGGAEATEGLRAGERGVAVLDRTVFYAEGGGQVADHGSLGGARGRARVHDVQKDTSGVFLHWLEVTEGELAAGDSVALEVDEEDRRRTERHHTATHLLHAALRRHLGDSVRQAGSLVHPERLRFDFTAPAPLAEGEKRVIEDAVNEWVRHALPVTIAQRRHREAVAAGAMALFGEKYGDVVRTVEVPGFATGGHELPRSLELCGGCHVRNTGEIGAFAIVGERGVASGVRRIEALAGGEADRHRRRQEELLAEVERALGAPAERAAAEIRALREKLRESERELAAVRMRLLAGGGEAGGEDSAQEVSGVRVLTREVPAAPMGELRNLADVLRGRLGSGVVVIGAREGDKVSLIATVTDDLAGRVHAGQVARSMGDAVGGSGGGRPDFAQAGGRDPSRLPAAFEAARRAVSEQLGAAS
jgi:alanyl-tRNA synthetase